MTDVLSPLRTALPEAAFREITPTYTEEPRGRWTGQAEAVVAPATTGEVAAVLKACNETGTPVVPFGGGTGLVGGQLKEDGAAPLILSLERMTRVRDFDPVAGTMVVEAGAILADVHATAEAEDWIFPLTLASQGSARLGGLLATNAGGVNVPALRQCARSLFGRGGRSGGRNYR